MHFFEWTERRKVGAEIRFCRNEGEVPHKQSSGPQDKLLITRVSGTLDVSASTIKHTNEDSPMRQTYSCGVAFSAFTIP